MKKIYLIGIFLSMAVPSYSAFTANMVWEVEPTSGNDQNGCGWDTASAGVDKTTWTVVSLSGLTSAGAGTTVLYSGALASDVGNVVNITGGTNFTPNRYRITAASVGTSWTTDKAVTTGAGISGTGFAFGPCQSLQPLTTTYIGSNSIYVKSESLLVLNSSVSFTVGGTPSNTVQPVRVIGYSASRGDRGMPHFQMNSGTPPNPAVGFLEIVNGVSLENIWMDCNGVAGSTGIITTSQFENFYNLKVSSCGYAGIGFTTAQGGISISSSEFTAMISGSTGAVVGVNAGGPTMFFYGNNVHDNVSAGIRTNNGQQPLYVVNNIFSNNSGSADDCIFTGWGGFYFGNSFYKCGRDGIRFVSLNSPTVFTSVLNNIFDGSGNYGIEAMTAGSRAQVLYDGNAHYNNTAGNRNNLDDAGSVNKINGIGIYTNQYDIVLTSDPFVNAAGNDFRLNSSIGGGGSVLFKGVPPVYPAFSQTSYPSMGTYGPGPMPKAAAQ